MTRDEIVALAREAGAVTHAKDAFGDPTGFSVGVANFERFAALVAAAEHKACLEIADLCADADMHASMAANAIRARSQE